MNAITDIRDLFAQLRAFRLTTLVELDVVHTLALLGGSASFRQFRLKTHLIGSVALSWNLITMALATHHRGNRRLIGITTARPITSTLQQLEDDDTLTLTADGWVCAGLLGHARPPVLISRFGGQDSRIFAADEELNAAFQDLAAAGEETGWDIYYARPAGLQGTLTMAPPPQQLSTLNPKPPHP